jgi:phosphoribosylformylglycinamidine cyclo-ligase
MYKVFNMGHRFEVYTDQETAQEVIKISKTFNVDAQIIGRCEASDAKRVTVKSEHGEFNY